MAFVRFLSKAWLLPQFSAEFVAAYMHLICFCFFSDEIYPSPKISKIVRHKKLIHKTARQQIILAQFQNECVRNENVAFRLILRNHEPAHGCISTSLLSVFQHRGISVFIIFLNSGDAENAPIFSPPFFYIRRISREPFRPCFCPKGSRRRQRQGK